MTKLYWPRLLPGVVLTSNGDGYGNGYGNGCSRGYGSGNGRSKTLYERA
jgi:hypothetical protein